VARVRDVAAVSAFDDYFARMMPDVEAWFAEHAAQPVVARSFIEMPAGEIRKLSSVIEVPDELLMDAGLIPDTRPKPPPPTRRQRIRRKLGDWRERAARRAYRIIAGYWPDNGEDDW
jgi:hypothetical protein